MTTAGLALKIAGTDAVALKTTVLMTPEEIDRAVKTSTSYRAPGR